MKPNNIRTEIVSDVYERNGIGIELYYNNELTIDIFRNDAEKTRSITTFNKTVSIELMEKALETFKKEIPWEFIETNKSL